MEPLRWSTLLVFGAPAAGYAYTLLLIQFYFLKFAADVLLLAPAAAGALIGVGRLWDAVSDPLAGFLSDRTRTRWGRRRPWMLAGVPLCGVFFVLAWSPPEGLGEAATLAWCGAALLGFYTAYTIYSVPHLSLGAELTRDHHARSRVFATQRGFFVVGMMVSFGGVQLLTTAEDPREAARGLALAAALATSAVLLLAPLLLREPASHLGRGAARPFDALRDVVRNPHARRLLLAWLVEGLGGGVLGVLAPFVATYVLRRPDLTASLPAFYLVAALLSLPLWVLASRRFGKRNVWLVAILGQALCLGGTFFVTAGDGRLVALMVLLVAAGASSGCGGAIGASMLADTIDWDELHSGQRKEGAYSAAWGFALKASIGFVVLLVGVALQLAGFEPNAEQSPRSELVIRGLFAGAPLLAGLGAFLVLRGFRFDEAEHARVLRELAARES